MDKPKPVMENINDQKREERVAGFIEGLWNVRCHKLPVSYGLDYLCESKEVSFWLEVKCRTFDISKYNLDGTLDQYEENYIDKTYPFNKDNVLNFAEFAKNSGGFQIY